MRGEFLGHLVGVIPLAQNPGRLRKRGARRAEGKGLEDPSVGQLMEVKL